MQELTSLAQYGLTGVSISLIVLLGFFVKKLFTLVQNHMDHNTDAMNRLANVIEKLDEHMRE